MSITQAHLPVLMSILILMLKHYLIEIEMSGKEVHVTTLF